MRTLKMLVIVVVVSLLTGCGGDTGEAVANDMVANMKEMGEILTSVTDEASANAAVPKIQAVRAKMQKCGERAKAIRVNAKEEEKLNKILESGMMEAMGPIITAQERLFSRPDLMAIIQPAMEGMENDL